MEFKFYHLICQIDFINDKNIIGNYCTTSNERIEMKAIHKYKDAIWDMQGLMNNSISYSKYDFNMRGHVTLYGVTYDDNYVIIRHVALNM